jgi:hypothetical protein
MADQEQIESLKQISEWCKWLVAVESAGIGLIASFVKGDNKLPIVIEPSMKAGFVVAIIAFVCSIVVAGTVVSAIPDSIADIEPGSKVMDRGIYFLDRSVGPIYVYAELLFGLFLVGVLAFAFSIIRMIIRI